MPEISRDDLPSLGDSSGAFATSGASGGSGGAPGGSSNLERHIAGVIDRIQGDPDLAHAVALQAEARGVDGGMLLRLLGAGPTEETVRAETDRDRPTTPTTTTMPLDETETETTETETTTGAEALLTADGILSLVEEIASNSPLGYQTTLGMLRSAVADDPEAIEEALAERFGADRDDLQAPVKRIS
jgi:hypothetical protein